MWASTSMVLMSLICTIGINIWLIIRQKANLFLVLVPSALILILSFFMFFHSDGNKDLEIHDETTDKLNMIHVVSK